MNYKKILKALAMKLTMLRKIGLLNGAPIAKFNYRIMIGAKLKQDDLLFSKSLYGTKTITEIPPFLAYTYNTAIKEKDI